MTEQTNIKTMGLFVSLFIVVVIVSVVVVFHNTDNDVVIRCWLGDIENVFFFFK